MTRGKARSRAPFEVTDHAIRFQWQVTSSVSLKKQVKNSYTHFRATLGLRGPFGNLSQF